MCGIGAGAHAVLHKTWGIPTPGVQCPPCLIYDVLLLVRVTLDGVAVCVVQFCGWEQGAPYEEKKKCLNSSFAKRPCVAQMFNHGWWRLAVGGWRLAVGGGWQWLAIGGWSPLAVGGWWLAVGGPLGRSLTRKKSSSCKPRSLSDGNHKNDGSKKDRKLWKHGGSPCLDKPVLRQRGYHSSHFRVHASWGGGGDHNQS